MIAYLKGRILRALPTGVILDVQGTGYELSLSLRGIANLAPEGSDQQFWVYTRVREDEISLYGFESIEERQTFTVLMQVNGVGPKVGLAILSYLSLGALLRSVESDEPEALYPVPGIGKRTAEKIMVELKGRLDRFPSLLPETSGTESRAAKTAVSRISSGWGVSLESDIVSALENLGFKEKEISPVLRALKEDYAGEDFSNLVKKALRLISSGFKGRNGASKSPGARGQGREKSLNKLF